MRLLILSIYHDPEPIPKTGDLAREMQRRGHIVTVVTAFPHYPTGRLYPGYRLAPWRWEQRAGVSVLRTFIFPYHGRRSSLRILNYLTWMVSSIQAAWLAPQCDVLYVWHPPLTVGVSAWVISKLKRVKFVYDVQDLWPESALAAGLLQPGPLVNVLYRLADWVYTRAHRILVVSAAAAEHLRERGVDAGKISVAQHWVDTSAFRRSEQRDMRMDPDWGGNFVVVFAGNLGLVQGLETVIDAAALLLEERIQFVFVGEGADRARLERLAAEGGVTNVRFAGYHPVEEMPAWLRAADALLVHLRPSTVAEHAIPTKIISYLAAGRPIVCATGGAAAGLVQEAHAGVVVEPGNAASLAEAVRQMASMPPDVRAKFGTNGLEYFNLHFDQTRVLDFYEHALEEMADTSKSRTTEAGQRT